MGKIIHCLLSAACCLLLLGAPAQAQESYFYFSAKPTFDADYSYQKNIEVRPNSTSGLFVFVKGPKELNKATVELWGPDDKDKPWIKSLPLKFEQTGQIARVQFQKVEEKKAATPEAAAAPAPAAAATPPAPPPPPGKMLSFGKQNGAEVSRSFKFKLVLVEERDNRPGEKWTEEVAVSVLSPDRYLTVTKASSTPNSINLTVLAKDDDTARKAFINGKPSIVTLVFPPQPDLDSAGLASGTYRRAIAEPGASVTLNAVDLPIQTRQRENAKIRFYVEADGYPRGFIYQPTLTQFERGELQLDSGAKVRIYPGNVPSENNNGTYYARPVAKPTDRYPVRVELDNPVADARVDFVFNRSSAAASSPAKDEMEVLAGPRETKVWLDPASEEGQFTLTNQCQDWIVPLDTYMLRGAHSVSASFKNGATASDDKSVVLTLDDTAPNRIEILMEDVHVKGLPLKVDALVADKETPIKRVIFFVGPPPGPDGKRPADPIKVEGVQDKAKPALWHGELPLAPEAKGVLQVGVTATNEVGLEATEVKTIKLVDAPLPAGDISVTVMRGDRPQPGVIVGLKDAENKEKSVGTTDDKGIVKFEKLPPGLYLVATAKPDSSSGTKAAAPAKVEAGKTTEVTLPLKRGP
jgi:hypothetical protein